MTTANAGHPGQQPVITVTRGQATRAEIAAIVAVLLSVRTPAAVAPAAESARPSRWAEGARDPARPAPSRPAFLACIRPAALIPPRRTMNTLTQRPPLPGSPVRVVIAP